MWMGGHMLPLFPSNGHNVSGEHCTEHLTKKIAHKNTFMHFCGCQWTRNAVDNYQLLVCIMWHRPVKQSEGRRLRLSSHESQRSEGVGGGCGVTLDLCILHKSTCSTRPKHSGSTTQLPHSCWGAVGLLFYKSIHRNGKTSQDDL